MMPRGLITLIAACYVGNGIMASRIVSEDGGSLTDLNEKAKVEEDEAGQSDAREWGSRADPASAKDIETAKKVAEDFKEVTPKLADPQCQTAIGQLQEDVNRSTQSVGPMGELKSRSGNIAKRIASKVRSAVLGWKDGAGKACEPFMAAASEKTGDGSDESRKGIIINVGFVGTALFHQLEGTIGVVVHGHRLGQVILNGAAGIETTIIGGRTKTSFVFMKDTTNLNDMGCAIQGRYSIPGFPVKLFSVGLVVVLDREKNDWSGIGFEALVGPSLDFGFPVGVKMMCHRTKELKIR